MVGIHPGEEGLRGAREVRGKRGAVRFGYAIVVYVVDPERTADFWEVVGLELGVRNYDLGKGHAIDNS